MSQKLENAYLILNIHVVYVPFLDSGQAIPFQKIGRYCERFQEESESTELAR